MKILEMSIVLSLLVTGCAAVTPSAETTPAKTRNEIRWQAPANCEAGYIVLGETKDGDMMYQPIVKCLKGAKG